MGESEKCDGWVLVDVGQSWRAAWSNEDGWIDTESDLGLPSGITVFSTKEILGRVSLANAQKHRDRVVVPMIGIDAVVVRADPAAIRAVVDGELSAAQLDDKYNPEGDGEHPDFPREDWRREVANMGTISGYWAWCAHELSWRCDEVLKDASVVLSDAQVSQMGAPAPGG